MTALVMLYTKLTTTYDRPDSHMMDIDMIVIWTTPDLLTMGETQKCYLDDYQ